MPDILTKYQGGYKGVGIENVRSRIQTVVKGSMEIQSSAQGTTVTLKIPLAGEYHAFFGSR